MTDYIISYRLKKLRQQKKLTQVELAKIIQVSQNTISSWESGRQEPSTQMLVKLAEFFKISFLYFFGLDDKTRKALYGSLDEIRAKILNGIESFNKAMFRIWETENKELREKYELTTDEKEKNKLSFEITDNVIKIESALFQADFDRLANIDPEPYSDPLAEYNR